MLSASVSREVTDRSCGLDRRGIDVQADHLAHPISRRPHGAQNERWNDRKRNEHPPITARALGEGR